LEPRGRLETEVLEDGVVFRAEQLLWEKAVWIVKLYEDFTMIDFVIDFLRCGVKVTWS